MADTCLIQLQIDGSLVSDTEEILNLYLSDEERREERVFSYQKTLFPLSEQQLAPRSNLRWLV